MVKKKQHKTQFCKQNNNKIFLLQVSAMLGHHRWEHIEYKVQVG